MGNLFELASLGFLSKTLNKALKAGFTAICTVHNKIKFIFYSRKQIKCFKHILEPGGVNLYREKYQFFSFVKTISEPG